MPLKSTPKVTPKEIMAENRLNKLAKQAKSRFHARYELKELSREI
jgi:hypothetical protein